MGDDEVLENVWVASFRNPELLPTSILGGGGVEGLAGVATGFVATL